MSTELAVRKGDVIELRNMDDLARLAKMFADSGYFKDARDAAQTGVKILAGRELGFGPFASMNGIHLIQGKPSMGANLMAAAIKSSGKYDYRVRKMDDTEVSIEFFERGESLGVSTFTKKDADKAGTQNMGKFPRNMLYARAMSNGVKWYTPDVFTGNTVYTPEELGANVDEDGEVLDVQVSVTPEPSYEAPSEPQEAQEEDDGQFPPEDDLPESLKADKAPDEPDSITAKQLKLLAVRLKKAGFTDSDEHRSQAREYVLWLLERGQARDDVTLPERSELESSKDLTKGEASYVIGIVKDDDVLNESVAAWTDERAMQAEEAA